jgi:peptidoglycan hydrolase-like protein with peptidoglycan-binding domain
MGSRWNGTGRSTTVAAAAGTAVLAAAAAVLVASASGALGTRSADAATAPAPAHRAATAPASAAHASAGSPAKAPGAPVATPASKRGPRTSLTHLPGNGVANGTRGVAIRLNGRPALGTPRPTLTPRTAGSWTDFGDYEFFHPVSTLEPCASYTMTIPARTAAGGHRTLGRARTITFSVACPGITAVQEALARLNYLPYTLHGFVGASSIAPLTRAQAAKRAFALPNGVLRANVRAAPPLTMGTVDPTTTGAMQVFEEDHGLPLSATPTEQLWTALVADETLAKRNPKPYTWVTVTETIPETLQVHENNKVALTSLTNTGVPGATTQQGVFPIYIRYVATTMIGTNVDGSHYNDPGVPWVNYFNGGDAVHGYIRPSYGVPQSNGCVELPIATAQTVYGMLAIGDLVIVE